MPGGSRLPRRELRLLVHIEAAVAPCVPRSPSTLRTAAPCPSSLCSRRQPLVSILPPFPDALLRLASPPLPLLPSSIPSPWNPTQSPHPPGQPHTCCHRRGLRQHESHVRRGGEATLGEENNLSPARDADQLLRRVTGDSSRGTG